MVDLEALTAKVRIFRDLHEGPGMLVMPNAWDAASARAFAAVGFPAIATTSGGVAASLGYEDHEDAPVEEVLAATARIVRSVTIPVTADLEAGFGLPGDVLVRRTIETGAVGFNLEDTDHRAGVLEDAERHAERIAACKAAARTDGVDLFLNARIDTFRPNRGTLEEQLAEALRRAHLYREAGADCVYPLGLNDEEVTARFVQGAGCLVNMASTPRSPSLARLVELGVRRVTYATTLFRRTLTGIEQLAAEIYEGLPPGTRQG